MAPAGRSREPSIDRSPEYEDFIQDLAEYHEKRGTLLEREPRVGNRHVDLLRLYKAVVERGGYDVVSAEKLAWRSLGHHFNLGTSNLPALAFNLKTAYYRNLAAFEITHVHKKEPPPREILEDVTARGAALLTRTVENYKPPGNREQGQLGNGEDSDHSGDEGQGTPNQDIGGGEEPGSIGRITRGLRQAPPQRVLFQPDLSSSRQTRNASANMSSPHSTSQYLGGGVNSSSNPNSMSFTVANYEPRPQMPLTLRQVVTLGNNPELFRQRQKALRESQASKGGRVASNYKGMMLPGTGFEGPNIYVRTLLALRSGIPEEEDYALHHLVKISHERGEKYRFEAFPGLAEGLVEKVLEITSLFYDAKWEVSYREDSSTHEKETLDGIQGTSDILARIASLKPLEMSDDMETEEFSHRLSKISEAGLVLRNMAMLEENAEHLSRLYPVRDFINVTLNLPPRPSVVELQHYALDIAEQITKYLSLEPEDPLYRSLLSQLESSDRGTILTTLRAISRISMNLEENNRLKGVPMSVVRRISDWTLIDDEELVNACLDFLYQFTAGDDNVQAMLTEVNIEGLINQLVRLLLYGAKEYPHKVLVKKSVKGRSAKEIPNLPRDLLEQLLKYEEPERSGYWLRACFEEDPDEDITQIALWQAYQSRFSDLSARGALLPAAEFIKNVSTTFVGATAQVLAGAAPKFIIKGIRPRHIPMDPRGRVYQRCLWRRDYRRRESECGEFLLKGKNMWDHIIKDHLHVPQREDGKWDFTTHPSHRYTCNWGVCTRFGPHGTDSIHKVGMHVKTHMPETKKAHIKAKHNLSLSPNSPREAQFQSHIFHNTAEDENQDAAGLPLTAALVLRNLARNLPKGEMGEREGGGWMRRLFAPVEPQLWFVMAHNKPLAGYMADLTGTIAAGV
ncbi:MAG: Chromatin structure-remodeling complex protein rsc9 [Geoglossum umbratile]|nr:MAG: Chromatin structure-remodeling complex protein rsc9 [Geoglossum umbratile]